MLSTHIYCLECFIKENKQLLVTLLSNTLVTNNYRDGIFLFIIILPKMYCIYFQNLLSRVCVNFVHLCGAMKRVSKVKTSSLEVSMLHKVCKCLDMLSTGCRNRPGLAYFLSSDQSMYAWVLGKVSARGANLSATAVMRIGRIDSETLGGTALLHGWVRSQLALAALCGQIPQSIGINVTVRAARAALLSIDKKKKHQHKILEVDL